MRNRRVFIGWSGADNLEIAKILSKFLYAESYSPIIGGEWRTSFTVSEEIIHQMNGCDFGLFLIEKEIRKNQNGDIVSMGFNANVMMELGYMLHKTNDHNRVRRILINVLPHELPSDLQGTWTDEIKRIEYPAGDEEARFKALSKAAEEIAERFFEYINMLHNTDKLDYFDHWDENKLDIYNFTGDTRIGDKLIYGMQAAIYSGDFDRLYNTLLKLKERLLQKDTFNDYGAVACAIATLSVFVTTRRLTLGLTDLQFGDLYEQLECEYEKDIKDKDLKTWCKIFRKDKLELCYELCAATQTDPQEKIEYYEEALQLCYETIELIEEHVNSGSTKKDENYALLYLAFSNRNISQIHKALKELEPHKAEEHLAKQKEYCKRTYEYRKALYNYYKSGTRENSLAMDFVSQEYYLALVEQYEFEDKSIEKKKIMHAAKYIHDKLEDRARVQNMILQSVRNQNAGFLLNE